MLFYARMCALSGRTRSLPISVSLYLSVSSSMSLALLKSPFEKGCVKDFYACYIGNVCCADTALRCSAFYFQSDLCLSQDSLLLWSPVVQICGRASLCVCVWDPLGHSYALLVRRLLSPISLWLKPLQPES